AVASSTSGGSRNVLAALEEARRRKMTCLGLAGYGGGPMVARALVDHCITIDYEYIPRIQEAQASQYHILRRLIEMIRSAEHASELQSHLNHVCRLRLGKRLQYLRRSVRRGQHRDGSGS